jgi:predicted RNase H-like nuclease (RuvC/YqgF family)
MATGNSSSKSFAVIFMVLIIIGVVLYSLYNREHKKLLTIMEDQKVSLTDKITARDSVINEWILTFSEIEKNLAMIKEKEKIITLSSSDVEFSKDQRDRILEDIKYINSLLDQSKKKIASLNAQLKKSGGTIKALQIKITELEASMKQSESEISDLKTTLADKNFEIEQLNAEMTDMQVTIEQKDAEIVNKTAELNKGYYAYGTFKELKAKGLVTKEGGFIGLGKKISLIENFPDSAFTLINITETKTIPVNAKDAKLITEHPAGSFELIRSNGIVESVEIKDPAKFWKISKYAVVELVK